MRLPDTKVWYENLGETKTMRQHYHRPPTPPEEEPDPFMLRPPGDAGDDPYQITLLPPGNPGDDPYSFLFPPGNGGEEPF